MTMIKLLDTSTINKIAAGEVIERPFSVIKELVENSIDAGSSKIIVEIKEGGIPFIRVSDNGCGIHAEDIETAFTSHATSKISTISDLNTLHTLGFRGEALASIAAVSQLEITSKTSGNDSGTRLEIYGGEILSNKEIVSNTGTSIAVRNLFYNMPARKKFLKSAMAETGYISDYMNKVALSRPDICFRFINNGNEALFTSGNDDLKTAIFCVYGLEYAENMLEVNYSQDGITVNGYAGKQKLSRSNRLFEDVFINSRYIKDKVIAKAAEDVYKTYLTIGKFPAFVLNITMNPAEVDVNAHPQKLEVRFSDEQVVYNAVYSAVSKALKSANLIQQAEWAKSTDIPVIADINKNIDEKGRDVIYPKADIKQFFTAKEAEVYILDKPADFTENVDFEKKVFEAVKSVKTEQIAIQKEKMFSDYRIIGQAFQTYWIIEEEGKLYIIDQHAAHERIMFEETKARLSRSEIVSQTLLFPEKLSLSEREKGIVLENLEYFEALGFRIEHLEDELYLEMLPMIISAPENSQTVRQLVDMLSDGYSANTLSSVYDIKINSLATIACKAAVKGNDRLSEQEARAIIADMLSLENPFTCPHGRPTIVEITRYELELMFKRT